MFGWRREHKVKPVVWLGIHSLLTVVSFQLNLDLTEVMPLNVLDSFLYFINSFHEYSIIYIFLVPVVYCFYKYIYEINDKKVHLSYVILAMLFSFFMVMGYSYEQLGNWDLVINRNNLQWMKALIIFSGYVTFFYYCVSYVFYRMDFCNIFLSHEKNYKVNILIKYFVFLRKKPFLTAFVTLFLVYLPYIVVSYPAIFGYDMLSQITSSYAELGIYSPRYTSQFVHQEGIYLNNHHPIVHTLFIHGCLEIGERVFSSYNIGIFICALSQLLFMLFIISILVQLLVELEISDKYIFLVLLYYAFSPRIQSYMFFITKDVLFAAFSLLFVICLFQIVRDDTNKHNIILFVSALGVMLFRNDGRYLLLVSFIGIAILCTKIRRRMLVCAVAVALFGTVYSNIVLPTLHIMPGSVKEVLSVPFQQTARYLKYSSDPITQEEKEAIAAILDYDTIIEKYNPETSDNVKDTYNVIATREELKEYFKVYVQMFMKHPSHYIQATMNNYYYYFYPGPRLASYYGYSYSDSIIDIANDRFSVLGMNFGYPQALNKCREIYEQLREGVAKLPIISMLVSSATYSWILILLVFYCIKEKKKEAITMAVPLCVQLLISLAGPCNGWYFRYVYPIAICLPAVALMSIYLVKTDGIKFEETERI